LWRMEPPTTNNGRLDPRRPQAHKSQQETPLLTKPFVPSTSNMSSVGSRQKHGNLSDVVTTSGNTTDLARNLGMYVNEKIPPSQFDFIRFTWSLRFNLQSSRFRLNRLHTHHALSDSIRLNPHGYVKRPEFILSSSPELNSPASISGTFNIPFCQVQPMIPIWLIVAGVLFIITATLRIFRLIPAPRRSSHRSRALSLDLCCRLSEGLFFVINVVWLTLGCIWVYGSKPYVHFEEHMFEEHYCDWTLYWIAFWTCTIYLIMICVLIILLISFMAIVSSKESAENEQEL
uniref:G_PROTEIN_RECEP_F2_4 domain-containing protein n=1 Tax=Heligmosomoides polygyrus TaxID=6339 RepID=A0A183GGF8_HELPZ